MTDCAWPWLGLREDACMQVRKLPALSIISRAVAGMTPAQRLMLSAGHGAPMLPQLADSLSRGDGLADVYAIAAASTESKSTRFHTSRATQCLAASARTVVAERGFPPIMNGATFR